MSNEQRAASSEQRATSNEQRATSNEWMEPRVQCMLGWDGMGWDKVDGSQLTIKCPHLSSLFLSFSLPLSPSLPHPPSLPPSLPLSLIAILWTGTIPTRTHLGASPIPAPLASPSLHPTHRPTHLSARELTHSRRREDVSALGEESSVCPVWLSFSSSRSLRQPCLARMHARGPC